MSLSTQQQILIEQRVANEAKSTGAAYLIWLFLGGLGGHRFYLGRPGTGAAILGLTVVGLLTIAVGIGMILLIASAIWVLVDAFLIPGMVQQNKDEVRRRLSMDALTVGGPVREALE